MKRLLTHILLVFIILSAFGIAPVMADAGPEEILRGYDLKKPAADALKKVSASLARTAKTVSDKDVVEKIKKLQRALQAAGLYQNCRIDGWFGPYTEMAVMEYQRSNNIAITGKVDDKLLAAIIAKSAKKTVSQDAATKSLASSSFGQFMKPTRNCPSTDSRIVSLAKSLKGGSTYETMQKIFYYVRNKVSYRFYYNSSKGALGTLSSKAGNCCDQAHLLIALLRAAGIPAKYGHGTCRFSSGTYGHVFAYAYVNGKWLLVDPVSRSNQINKPSWRAVSTPKTYAALSF
ncbi:MAG: hypothetical protein CVV41_03015 [Candidatus Riflebacteria bacterium HGW-Riflebacteria-1]|jgi:hypothetical protein|nr:MAG: hypothetical protein CVV41_03015 [Candidatus Riflebacteria bacterium HGW-Riflebacteria-1]